ncbi:exonuclease SbcCD, C subunit [[Eubacterium] yurii subsp. margaretiae ATCC 43715]|nr:exonuclease SbcCD, C subunit [[Eubacterium] yurii subsp. margaretiae ATCC 43715]
MRPILLEIEGFNSFEKKQTIDFEKLTSMGLFGIFGNTGSGKTTILDAIIYALYEKTPRESDNIININSKKASVRYVFEIKGKGGGIYEIQRSTTLSKTGGKKAKLTKIEQDTQVVLASDKKTEVDAKIQDIIGLGYNDFVKTVVLPQGEFSNFLKEKNKTRKEMLERLFALQKYGDDLDLKIRKYKQRYDELQKDYDKQLQGYEDIDENSITELKKDIENTKSEIQRLEKEVIELDKLQNEYNILEKLKDDFEKAKETYNNIVKYDEIMKSMKIKVEKLSKLTIIQDSIAKYSQLKADLPSLKSDIENLKTKLKQLDDENTKYINQKTEVEKEVAKIPEIEKYIQEIEKSILLKKEISKIVNLQKDNEENIKQTTNSLKEVEKELSQNIEESEKLKSSIRQIELDIKDKTFNHSYKQDVRFANSLLENLNVLDKEIENLKKESLSISNNIQVISDKISSDEKMEKSCSIELEGIMQSFQDDIYNVKAYEINESKLIRLENTQIQSQTQIQNLENLQKKLKENEDNKAILSEKISILSLKRNTLEDEIKTLKIENIVHEIRQGLHDGDTCPVCNGSYHHIEDVTTFSNIDDKEEELNKLIKELQKTETSLSIVDNDNQNIKSQIEEIRSSLDEIDSENMEKELEKCRNYKSNYNIYMEKRLEKQAKADKIQKLINTANTNIQVNKSKLNSLEENKKNAEEKIEKNTKSQNEISEKIQSLSEKLAIDSSNLAKELDKIIEAEKSIEECNISLSKEKSNLENLEKIYRNLNENISDLNKKLNSLMLEKERLKSSYSLEIAKIADKTLLEKENLTSLLQEKKIEIRNIQEKSENIQKLLENIEKEIAQKSNNLTKIETVYEVNFTDFTSYSEKIELFIKNNDFNSIDEVFKLNEEYDKLEDKKKKIQNYENQKNESLIQKNLTEKTLNLQSEKLKKLEETKKYDRDLHSKIKEQLDINKKTFGYLESRLETQKANFEKKKDLLTKSKENQKILDEVTQIFNLFKGKAFVQFLAKYQLNYVCKKASEILQDISGGRFHIEIDKEGDFLILDYSNGGISRNPSTLSGGETFLVSLSLALALSSQIQLKGNAPLEFFFMDEGFGTLDSHTLDIALDCLKKIKNENLSIGIISHIDKIKEFVPIKLEITKDDILNTGSSIKIVTG